MTDRPNFFDLLDLDPGETHREVIEKRIQEKKTVWARDSTMGSPRKRQEAKRNMALLSELQGILSDPKLWRQEAEEALRRRGEARKVREKELQEWIDLLKGSGHCGDEHLVKICRQLEGIFTEQEIRERLEAAGIRVGSNGTAPKSRPRTDSVTAENIRRNLNLLKLASLYEFLDRSADTSAADLRARGDEILRENQRHGRTDAEATARNDLAGLAKTVFQSEEEKKKYDTHRVLEAVEAIENQVQAAGADGVLSSQELETLIRLVAQRGASEEEAREILDERAAKEGWKVERAAAGPASAPREASSSRGTSGAGDTSAGGTRDDGVPPAPGRLIVRPIAGGLRLSWEAVRLQGVRYRVLRKIGSVPWDEGDGELVIQTGETQADDTAVPPAVPWHYAVFSLRNGLASDVPAHSGPHLILATAGTAPDPASSTNIGGLPIRRLAAAGLATLVLGGGAAAFWWGPLTGMLVKPSSRPVVQTRQIPAQGISTGPALNTPQPPAPTSPTPTQTPGPQQPAPGPGTPSSQPVASVNQGGSGAKPVPQQKTLASALGNNSGSTTPSTSVAGASAKLPIVPISPRPLALPTKPEVAVIAMGDALLATSLEAELEKAFRDEGLDVVGGSAGIDSLRRHRGGSQSVSDILATLRGDGVHAVVIAQVDHLADRELSFYGRKDVSSTSRVRIQAYLVDGHRSIGSWSEQIEYTAVNASTEGENAAHRAAPSLANSVRSGWQAALRGSSPTTP